MITNFNYKGHHFKVVPVEGNPEEFIITKDDVQTRRVTKDIAAKAMQNVDKLFKVDQLKE